MLAAAAASTPLQARRQSACRLACTHNNGRCGRAVHATSARQTAAVIVVSLAARTHYVKSLRVCVGNVRQRSHHARSAMPTGENGETKVVHAARALALAPWARAQNVVETRATKLKTRCPRPSRARTTSANTIQWQLYQCQHYSVVALPVPTLFIAKTIQCEHYQCQHYLVPTLLDAQCPTLRQHSMRCSTLALVVQHRSRFQIPDASETHMHYCETHMHSETHMRSALLLVCRALSSCFVMGAERTMSDTKGYAQNM